MKFVSKALVIFCFSVTIGAFAYADDNVLTSDDNTVNLNVYSNDNRPGITVDSDVYKNISAEKKGVIISVNIPTKIEVVLDPYNSKRKGQVTATDMTFENYSSVPVELKLKKCYLNVPEGSEVVFPENEISDESLQKEILLYIKESGKEEKYKIIDGDMNISFGAIDIDKVKTLNLDGIINSNGLLWTVNDIIELSFVFDYEPIVEQPKMIVPITPLLPPSNSNVTTDVYNNQNNRLY